MAISAETVRELREQTGAGMMDCKRALEEAGGEMNKAVAILRERGLASAAKKSGRLASEGLVAAYISADRRTGALVEVNCETDFVAANQEFAGFVKELAARIAGEERLATTSLGGPDTIGDIKMANGLAAREVLTGLVAKIGENMSVRRFARFVISEGGGAIESYIHLGGKIGVLIQLGCAREETASNPSFLTLARDLCMQIAAARPEYITRQDVPAEVLEDEKAIYRAQALNEGKPAQVAEKIVFGRVDKFFKEVCLLEQPFVKDNTQSCRQVIEAVASRLGDDIKVVRFARFERGEGLAKRATDFAREVQEQIGS